MDFFELYQLGLPLVFNIQVLFSIALGTFIGIVFGSLPGLTATMGVAILVPLTYGMDPIQGIAALIGVYGGGIYGGSISAILVNIPGTPSSVATTFDGYPMTQRGEAGRAIGISVTSSVLGGLFSIIILGLFAPIIAQYTLRFSAQEYVGVTLFGLSMIAVVSQGSVLKGLFSGSLGLFLGTIGMDPVTGFPRFTMGQNDLLGGIAFIPVMIGLFGISEILIQSAENIKEISISQKIGRVLPTKKDLTKLFPVILRSSILGVIVGIIPAAGGTIANIISYGQQKNLSKHPEEMGKGSIEGLAAPEAANNATTGGALIPFLTLAIPGDAVTAVLLGGFLIHNLQPGPMIFQNNPDVVSAIFISLIVANVFLFTFAMSGANLFAKIISAPKNVLYPVLVILCMIGSYAIRNSAFDIGVMIIAGIIGYFMRNLDVPIAPLVLALILGPMFESNLRRAFILSDNVFYSFISRPISLFFLLFTIILFMYPIIKKFILRKMNS